MKDGNNNDEKVKEQEGSKQEQTLKQEKKKSLLLFKMKKIDFDDGQDQLARALELSASAAQQREELSEKVKNEKQHLMYDITAQEPDIEKYHGSIGAIYQNIQLSVDEQRVIDSETNDTRRQELGIIYRARHISKEYGYPYPIAQLLLEKLVEYTPELDEKTKQEIKVMHKIAQKFITHPQQFFDSLPQGEKENLLVVLSVGSGGFANQQAPNFAIQAAEEGAKVFILNVDPGFKEGGDIPRDEIELKTRGKDISVFYLPGKFPMKKEEQYFHAAYLDNFIKLINEQVSVSLVHNGSPILPEIFYDISRTTQKVGEELAVIGAYHNNQPCFIYNQDFFNQNHRQTSRALMNMWCGCSLEEYLKIINKSMEEFSKEFASIGIVHPTLKDVPLDTLFKKEQKVRFKT